MMLRLGKMKNCTKPLALNEYQASQTRAGIENYFMIIVRVTCLAAASNQEINMMIIE